MHTKHNQVSPELESNVISRPSISSKLASNELCFPTAPNITDIVPKVLAEQRRPRRRSLDYMLGDDIALEQRNREEIVRETLRQVNQLCVS
jgi:hypothetical protein